MAKMSEFDADRQRIERLTDVGHPPSFADSARAGAPPHTPTPKLVMGYIEVVGPDGEEGIPYDEAVIHLEGDEDSEIEVHCPGALRLAPLIVKAVNSHDALVKALTQIEQLSDHCVNAEHYTAQDALADLSGIRNIIKGAMASMRESA